MVVEQWLSGFITKDAPRGLAALNASRELFAALGDPQDRVQSVHIVGTAGKGTAAAMIASGLRDGGGRVGLHMSPHVHDVRERFTVEELLPAWADVEAAVAEIEPVARSMTRAGTPPTFFAVTAAIAAVMARQAQTEWLVIEAGIGGRVDATNVFNRSDTLTVVTAIGVDHSEVLGKAVGEIAAEKAAVLAGRTHAVMGPQPSPVAAAVIREVAESSGCELLEVPSSNDWIGDARATAGAALALLGDQHARPLSVTESHGLLPGRFETHTVGATRLVFDGAHNPMKLRALAASLQADPHGPVSVVLAVGANKDLAACADEIAKFAAAAMVTTFGFEEPLVGPRSWGAAETMAALRVAGIEYLQVFDPAEGTGQLDAFENRNEPATVVVTGSFLHLTAVREVLLQGS